eukprot:8039461-Pyramimonas_sp.AAC.1
MKRDIKKLKVCCETVNDIKADSATFQAKAIEFLQKIDKATKETRTERHSPRRPMSPRPTAADVTIPSWSPLPLLDLLLRLDLRLILLLHILLLI